MQFFNQITEIPNKRNVIDDDSSLQIIEKYTVRLGSLERLR